MRAPFFPGCKNLPSLLTVNSLGHKHLGQTASTLVKGREMDERWFLFQEVYVFREGVCNLKSSHTIKNNRKLQVVVAT